MDLIADEEGFLLYPGDVLVHGTYETADLEKEVAATFARDPVHDCREHSVFADASQAQLLAI
ncbi:MAG: hypothetical protein WCA16_11370 [Candidatus Sulfotelmatobacter sp.]